MFRKRLLLALGLLVVASMVLGLGGCKRVVPGQVRVEEPEKTLVICQGQEPDSLYIHGTSMLAALHIQTALYDTSNTPGAVDTAQFGYQATITTKLPTIDDGDAVIRTVTVSAGDKVVDNEGNAVELAEGVMIRPSGCRSADCAIEYDGTSEVEMDQLVVTFTLVEGLTWADGEPVKASDSVYSFRMYMDPATPVASRYAGERTASYEATDDRTIVWTGLPGFMDSTYFANIWIPLPEHQLGHLTAAELVSAQESSRTPMGYGPFTTIEWVQGDHITLFRNYYYYREGLPLVDEVIYRFIGEDPNVAIAQLASGECDILSQDTNVEAVIDLLLEQEQAGVLVSQIVPGTLFEHIDFGINPVESYNRPDFFEDVRVRHAIAMCLDRQSVIDELYFGRTVIADSYVPPIHPLFNPNVVHYDYDPEAARELLEEAGWIDRDGDGIREAHGVAGIPDGTPLSINFKSTTAPLRVAAMQIWQANLAECGIEVILDNIPADQLFDETADGPLTGRHFDLAQYAFLTGVEPPCGLYLSSEIPSEENGWAGQNYPGYINPEYDQVCNNAMQSLPGTADYTRFHQEAQLIFSRDIPTLPLYPRLKVAASAPRVTGFVVDPTANTEFWGIENIDVTE